jgi:HEAT repeat protein
VAGLLVAAVTAAPTAAADGDATRAAPDYALPAGAELPALAPRLEDAARGAVERLRDPPGPEDTQEAARLLAGLGSGALPAVVDGLQGASWYVRAALVSAVSEMDAPAATPLLAAAARDPSFAVRSSAVTGLGKTGARGGSSALLDLADPAVEPVWRVRALVAPALRRAALRGTLPRQRAEDALTRMLGDPDPDVRRAALRATAPLAAPSALPHLLAVYADAGALRDDRAIALSGLRVYRDRPPELMAALRRGLTETDDPARAAEAGAALLDIGGMDVLTDPEVARAVLRQLGDTGAPQLREALARIGKEASAWLAGEALRLARRIARRKVEHHDTPLEALVETLLRVDREAAFGVLRQLVTGPEAEVMDPETRRFALNKVKLLFAPRLRDELRALFDSRAGDGVRKLLLEAIEASGGDDLAERLDAALRHPDGEARRAALALLSRRGDLPAGPALRDLASSQERDPVDRIGALDVLSRRDTDGAAALAVALLDDPRHRVRRKAVELVSGAENPEHYETILRRLAEEDGADEQVPPRAPAQPKGDTTPSGNGGDVPPEQRRRDGMRSLLLEALLNTGAERAREPLLAVLTEDPNPVLRATATRHLRRLVKDEDANLLLARHALEKDTVVQRELLKTLATLGGSERAREHFEALIGEPGRRGDALALLRGRDSQVMPAGLEQALAERKWNEEELETALFLLARAGRAPAPSMLAEIVREATTIDLAEEALSLLGASTDGRGHEMLVTLLSDLDDPAKLAATIDQVGRTRASGGLRPLLQLLDARRGDALAATVSTDPELNVYRRTAVALGRMGGEEIGRALVRHLLDPRIARLGARLSVAHDGPFKPTSSAPARVIRALVCGLAHLDDPTARALLEAELSRRALDGKELELDEGYVDGLARYLRDPGAYNLPHRRRPMTALPLQKLVSRLAPRLSELDREMTWLTSAQLETAGSFAAAIEAQRRHMAISEVENGGRSPEERLAERARERMLVARELGKAGEGEAARREADAIRAADPASAGLAYLHGYALVMLGQAGEESERSLRFSIAANERDVSSHFYLAWTVHTARGIREARTHYAAAHRLDRKRFEDAMGEYLTHRRGKKHPRAVYAYYYARALAQTGDTERAGELLHEAIRQDDRRAGKARRDPVFAAWDDLDALIGDALERIPASD